MAQLGLARLARPAARVARRGLPPAPFRALSIRPPVDISTTKLCLEEEATNLPPGLPNVPEEEVWKNPDMLLPEKAHLWWDDGTAVPEWYVDRTWPISTGQAVAELSGALAVIMFGVGGVAYLMGDCLRPVAPREEHLPFDLRREHGFPEAGAADDEDADEDEDDE